MSLLLVSIACYGAWQLQRVHSQSEALLVSKVNAIQSLFEFELQIQNLKRWLDLQKLKMEALPEKRLDEGSLEEFSDLQRTISHWLEMAESFASVERERLYLEKIRIGLSKFYPAIDELRELPPGSPDQAQLIDRAGEILSSEIFDVSRKMLSLDEEMLKSHFSKEAARTRTLVQLILILGFFGSIASLLTGYKIARTISNTLIQVQIPILDVAGKLSEVSEPVVVSKSLDLTDLSPALERLFGEVESVVNQLQVRHQEMLHAEQLATAGQLAAGIAHEIRNPLMSMKMLVQHALRPNAEGIDDYDLQILDVEIRRLEMLLDDFLEFARPQILRCSVIDLRPVIDGTLGLVQRLKEARRVELEYDPPQEPVLLHIDASRIKQVLLNLLLNAIQVTPPMGKIRLKFEQVNFHGKLACQLQISDDGPGLGGIDRKRLFEPFYSTKETGLGLGLPVSQRIVKQHGGEILPGPNGEGGAVFNIVLPFPEGTLAHNFQKL